MIEAAEPEPELLRIKSVSVEGLFGLYDHRIPFKLDDRVTIIHGPNGIGKTRILSWIEALFRLDSTAFQGVPFRSFGVELSNGASLEASPDSIVLRNASEKTSLGAVAKTVSVHFVEAQRLLGHREPTEGAPSSRPSFKKEPRFTSTVEDYSRDLKARIGQTLADYASQSQSLDQSFPQRIIQYKAPSIDVESLKTRMSTLDETRERLARSGLLREGERGHLFDVSALDGLEPERRLVLAVYVEDSKAKLEVLEDLAQRIQVFLDNLNGKFSNKRLYVDPKVGLVAENDIGLELALSDLSSGEQHEIVLLYDLLFNVRPNTLVLIDEPELSLHITWQKRFLDDLLQITKTVGIDALVATHSPFIIGEREDLMVPLEATPARR